MHRFYCPDIADTLMLGEEDSKHCIKVLRMAEGDTIEVVDGNGNLYTCRISMAHPKRCAIEVLDKQHHDPHWGHRIVLGIAPTKNLDRIEWLVEKCVEMGVDRIIPLSLKATLPQLDELTPIDRVLAEPFDGTRCIAYCDEQLPRGERLSLAGAYRPGSDVMVLIGPEGDFSPEEVQEARAAGFIPVTLGESRLRTETAGMMAVAWIHALLAKREA